MTRFFRLRVTSTLSERPGTPAEAGVPEMLRRCATSVRSSAECSVSSHQGCRIPDFASAPLWESSWRLPTRQPRPSRPWRTSGRSSGPCAEPAARADRPLLARSRPAVAGRWASPLECGWRPVPSAACSSSCSSLCRRFGVSRRRIREGAYRRVSKGYDDITTAETPGQGGPTNRRRTGPRRLPGRTDPTRLA